MGERTRELIVLVTGDIICFISALWLTLFVRYFEWPSAENLAVHLTPFLLLSGVWVFIFFSSGLYDKHTTLLKQSLRTRIVYTQIVNMVAAVVMFIVFPFGIAPKTNLAIYMVISTALIFWWRLKLTNHFSPKEQHKAILIADGQEAVELVDEINNNDRYNYYFVRIIDESVAKNTPEFESKLLQLIERDQISMVVASAHSSYTTKIMPVIFDMAFLNFRSTFLDFTKLYEDTFDREPISALQHDWFITHVSQSRSLFYDLFKRIADILGAIVLLIPCTIVFPIVAAFIKLEDKGPLLYRTERVGQFNRPITIYKFRTMSGRDEGTEALATKHVVTKIGSILRKTRLDELPQLFNVLRGDLSFIGPRPEMPALAAVYAEQIPYYNTRHFIKPGLSGWAQINDLDAPRGGVDIERTMSKLSYDLLYLKRRSLWLDLQIAIKTLATLILRTGS
ncbi:sugar transferase [Candidatus Kaiserbacteria bacterium]|nr:sugar transferase [Candidatus Kaiserbacteria bacterium]MCB9811663.1 sugar transferase [Candidatus Nomurabacteria bacterium]